MAVIGATNLWLYLFSLLSLSFLRLNTAVSIVPMGIYLLFERRHPPSRLPERNGS